MRHARFEVPEAYNEPIQAYAPGSPERASLQRTLEAMHGDRIEAPMVIGGKEVKGDQTFAREMPHDHQRVVADAHMADEKHVQDAIKAALEAQREWAERPLEERVSVFLKAADLIAGPWRDTINAATMLGQSKTVHQAEIEAVAELCDFLRFNCQFAEQIYAEQPWSPKGVWNRMEYRPLEGFVLAITPFNFTAIAGNLPAAPAIMGNVALWKPSEKQVLAAHYTMEIFREAGLPDGVINLLHGDGDLVSRAAMDHPEFAGLHFTGSATVMKGLWKRASENLDRYRNFPRLVGESGGKDFVVAHPSADEELADQLVVALGRAAFEYQGQKCSAASRAYIPRSLWPKVRDGIADLTRSIPMGDISDFSNFMGAVIDQKAFEKHRDAIARAKDDGLEVLAGGATDDSKGWFVDPTVFVSEDPRHWIMETELFGPILTVHVFDDDRWDETLELVDTTSPYGLTGSVFARDRSVIRDTEARLRWAAGNFYINDKPTGSVVGQQPFGGGRLSGTNDKAGSSLNLTRWISPRAIKETAVAPTDWRYPHMDED